MKKKVTVHDNTQDGYTYYLTAPIGKQFDSNFTPELTPQEMLQLGVFGGVYLRDSTKEFPKKWFMRAKFSKDNTKDKTVNYFKVHASQPLRVWKQKGWINEEHDPKGWFQWYSRYYMGRRIPEYDSHQIKRWKQMKRHIGQIKKHCTKGDFSCRPRQRQALLHWAYDSRKL